MAEWLRRGAHGTCEASRLTAQYCLISTPHVLMQHSSATPARAPQVGPGEARVAPPESTSGKRGSVLVGLTL
jgi:hypothetical protein